MEVTSPAISRAPKIPSATWAIIFASVAGGLVTLGVAGWRHPGLGQPRGNQWIIAAAMGVLALASWVWPVVVYRGGESEAFNTDEGIFVILALLVPPLLTLQTVALATVLAQVARRRPFIKSAFNAGQVILAAGLGLAVSRSIAAPSGSLTAGQLAAMVAGVCIYVLVNTVLIAGIVLPMGTAWTEFTSDLPVQMTLASAGALSGLILALAVQAHLWALALVIPGLVLERQLISARFAALHDRSRMKGLYEVTLEANRGLRRQAVLDTILGAARWLLRSPGAILTCDLGRPAAVLSVRRSWVSPGVPVSGGRQCTDGR
jgi:hypothetical protein